MKKILRLITVLFSASAALAAVPGGPAPASAPPHLEKRGDATQLIVNGQPFLILGGELHNSSSSNLDYLAPIWPRLVMMNLNTVLAPVSWEIVEPSEGHFDFTLVDGMLAAARSHHLHLILLWMGSWKNGTSRYAADWVKADQARFPRVQNHDGKTLEILTPLSAATRDADTQAYTALMQHLRETDSKEHTVLMIQMQNEVGVLGDSRDFSPAANAAFAQPVPAALMAYLTQHKDNLEPELKKTWDDAGDKTSGTWTEVFGNGPAADEIFMAWNYSNYMGAIAAAGKAAYPIPVYVNAWIIQPEDKGPGDYPSGGPQAHMHNIWRAGAPAIDILAPDVYLPDFPKIIAQYTRSGTPLFIPESRGGAAGAANAFYAIGQYRAIGFSPFGIDDANPLASAVSSVSATAGSLSASSSYNVTSGDPLAKAYAVLSELSPLILQHQEDGTIAGIWLDTNQPTQSVTLGNYTLNFDLRRNRRVPTDVPAQGYALAIRLGPDEYLVAGSDVQVTFAPANPADGIAGLLSDYEGDYVDGKWKPGRRLNGDEVQLNYKLSDDAANGQSGAGLRFLPNGPTIQRVTLYRYH